MSLPVSLNEFVGEMEHISEEVEVCINRVNGQFFTSFAEDRLSIELDDEADPDDGLVPEWQREDILKLREIKQSDDWLTLPSKYEIHEYAIMRDYCESVMDPDLRADLLDAIHGSGAFRRFKNMLDRRGTLDGWYAFRKTAFRQIARGWLEEHEIPYTND